MLGLLGGAAAANSDSIGRAPERVADEFLQGEVSPTGIKEPDVAKGIDPRLATDGFINTLWTTNLTAGKRPQLEATFGEPLRLVYVFITGLSSEPQPEGAEYRGRSKVLISVRRTGAEGRFEDFSEVEVADDSRRHGFYVGADNVAAVRLTVVKPSSTAAKTVSIAGVQFTKR